MAESVVMDHRTPEPFQVKPQENSSTGSGRPSTAVETIHHSQSRQCEKCGNGVDLEKNISPAAQHDEKKKNDSNLVTWDGPKDPENPFNMSSGRKWTIVITNCAATFCVSLTSSIFAPTVFVTADEFHTSSEVMLLGVSLYVLGFAFGPLIWGPMSEVYGRTRPLYIALACFGVFQIPTGAARTLEAIFICRFIDAVFGSAPFAIVGGMFADFLNPSQRGISASIFAACVFAGPVIGPVLGSFIVQSHLGWRWTTWITLIMSAFFTSLAFLCTPETLESTLLRRKAARIRHQTKNWVVHAKAEEQMVDVRSLLSKYFTKPMRMIMKEPILAILTLYMSLCYGLLYLSFEAFPIAFQNDRGWSTGVASLPFLAMFIGVVVASLMVVTYTELYYKKRFIKTRKLNPEDRLPPMIIGSILLPIGLFWFGWTSHPSTSWVPQVIAAGFMGCGIILIFMTGTSYLIDVYLINANSALSINSFFRSIVAASFPMFSSHMYLNLGVDWATSLMGFCCIALLPFPLIFYFYGAKIRTWSKYAIGPR